LFGEIYYILIIYIMNPIKAKDMIDGDNSELVCKGLLELYFDTKLTKLDAYHIMDFVDTSGIYYEVKGRNNKYSTYPTTMIGYNKLVFQHTLITTIMIATSSSKCIFHTNTTFLEWGFYIFIFFKESKYGIRTFI